MSTLGPQEMLTQPFQMNALGLRGRSSSGSSNNIGRNERQVARQAVDTALQQQGQPPIYAKPCTYTDECQSHEYCSAQWTCLPRN
jgi:hypothetical protein